MCVRDPVLSGGTLTIRENLPSAIQVSFEAKVKGRQSSRYELRGNTDAQIHLWKRAFRNDVIARTRRK